MEHTIDILLCDIEMPYGSGIDLVKWVREHSPDTECLFLTCHDDFSFAQQAIQLKCLDYILKPVPPERLTNVLKNAIEMLKKEREDNTYKKYGKMYVEKMSAPTEEAPGNNIQNVIEQIERYVHEHIAENLSVENLARTVHLSPDYLTKQFKKKHNQTIIDYITDQRMFLAKELLEQNYWSISMISAKVGYSNYSYFTRLFKKYYGVTPREHRQNYIK